MKRQKFLYALAAIIVLLVIAYPLSQHMFREENTITLPERLTDSETDGSLAPPAALNVLRITPQTVQTAIATLARPASYQRTQTVTLYWNGGESETTSQVACDNALMRIDTTLSDTTVSHTLTDGVISCVWYDDDTDWITVRVDQITTDALQSMPTYEKLLDLPTDRIVLAEYGLRDSVYCIYIKTAPDPDGYEEHYWISVQSGLLYAAERVYDGRVIYRFSATEPQIDSPDRALFLMPDGSSFPAH